MYVLYTWVEIIVMQISREAVIFSKHKWKEKNLLSLKTSLS